MRKKLIGIAAMVLAALFTVPLVIVLLTAKPTPPATSPVGPHYLTYNAETTKIYLISATTSYGAANETYITTEGQTVHKGTPLFIISVTLRNDYTEDNPPPPAPNTRPNSPADGTAYIYLNAQLYDQNGALNATDVSVSDFTLPAKPGTGLVVASGQTTSVNICLTTAGMNVEKCEVNLVFLADSIQP